MPFLASDFLEPAWTYYISSDFSVGWVNDLHLFTKNSAVLLFLVFPVLLILMVLLTQPNIDNGELITS